MKMRSKMTSILVSRLDGDYPTDLVIGAFWVWISNWKVIAVSRGVLPMELRADSPSVLEHMVFRSSCASSGYLSTEVLTLFTKSSILSTSALWPGSCSRRPPLKLSMA